MGRSSQSSELLVSRTWEIMESAEPVLTITLGNDLNQVWFGFVKWFFSANHVDVLVNIPIGSRRVNFLGLSK